jgi:hypothetical protein
MQHRAALCLGALRIRSGEGQEGAGMQDLDIRLPGVQPSHCSRVSVASGSDCEFGLRCWQGGRRPGLQQVDGREMRAHLRAAV